MNHASWGSPKSVARRRELNDGVGLQKQVEAPKVSRPPGEEPSSRSVDIDAVKAFAEGTQELPATPKKRGFFARLFRRNR